MCQCGCQHRDRQDRYPLYMQDRGDTVGMQQVKASLRANWDRERRVEECLMYRGTLVLCISSPPPAWW